MALRHFLMDSMLTTTTTTTMLVPTTFSRRRRRCGASDTTGQEISAGGTTLDCANIGGRGECSCDFSIRDVSDGCLTDDQSNTPGCKNFKRIGDE
mmetsp:Transcript_12568/g.14372  ORF Transcript_12568/g.14372 Transcript_12568/m.14372 type:complete len:95 (-) Transcript_12568:1267-1551(-)